MLVTGTLMLLVAWGYWSWTQDCPKGNYGELRKADIEFESGKTPLVSEKRVVGGAMLTQ